MPEPPVTPPDPPPDRRSPFEWSLAALRPADGDVARPSFMYKAGQASRDKVVRFWRWVAGGLAVLLVTGVVVAVGLVQAEQQRMAAAFAEAQAARAQVQPGRGHETVPATTASEYDSPSTRPTVRTLPATPPDQPAPAEIAAALERRRNILVGGLGLIPDSPPVHSPEPRGVPSYPGVLAAPRVEKKPPPVEGDPDPNDPPPPPDPR